MSNLFLTLALISVGWGIVSFMIVTAYLSGHGVKINYLLVRVLMFRYVNEYHRITTRERGKPGPWYYSFIVSMMLALVFAVVGLVLKRF